MIKSMTGYGAGKRSVKGAIVCAEIRTLNHRYLDIVARLPENCLVFEGRIKNLVKQVVKRGRVNLLLALETPKKNSSSVSMDFELADKYYNLLKTLHKKLKLTSAITIEQITSFPQVVVFEEKQEDLNKYLPDIKKAVILALDKLASFRVSEGRVIYKDIKKRICDIDKIIKHIEKKIPQVIKNFKNKAEKRIKSLDKTIDSKRVETEVAIFTQNSDVTEEVIRIKGHVGEFLKNLNAGNEIGKKLDFITQEIYREINTLSAKVGDYMLSEKAIEIKNQLEKIREQLQNVE